MRDFIKLIHINEFIVSSWRNSTCEYVQMISIDKRLSMMSSN